jgi:hypothetical protein
VLSWQHTFKPPLTPIAPSPALNRTNNVNLLCLINQPQPRQQQPRAAQLEAVTLEGRKKHDEALAKYEEVLVIQQRDLPVGDLDTHETLISIDRVIDQLKYASIDNGEMLRSLVFHCSIKVNIMIPFA